MSTRGLAAGDLFELPPELPEGSIVTLADADGVPRGRGEATFHRENVPAGDYRRWRRPGDDDREEDNWLTWREILTDAPVLVLYVAPGPGPT